MPWPSDMVRKGEVDQNFLLSRGLRIGRLMVIIPTMVSRTPLVEPTQHQVSKVEKEATYHRLMFRADGFAPSVSTTRIMAAAMTKIPEHRRTAITSFLLSDS